MSYNVACGTPKNKSNESQPFESGNFLTMSAPKDRILKIFKWLSGLYLVLKQSFINNDLLYPFDRF